MRRTGRKHTAEEIDTVGGDDHDEKKMQQDEGLASDGVGGGVSPLLEVISEQRPEGGQGREPLDLGKNILCR